jgi:hypothetical protein
MISMASATFSVCLNRGWAAVRPDVRRAAHANALAMRRNQV